MLVLGWCCVGIMSVLCLQYHGRKMVAKKIAMRVLDLYIPFSTWRFICYWVNVLFTLLEEPWSMSFNIHSNTIWTDVRTNFIICKINRGESLKPLHWSLLQTTFPLKTKHTSMKTNPQGEVPFDEGLAEFNYNLYIPPAVWIALFTRK